MIRLLVSVLAIAAIVTIAAVVGGPLPAVGAAVIGILWLAWRYDNDLGTCLPLTVLALVAIGMILLLVYLMAVDRPR